MAGARETSCFGAPKSTFRDRRKGSELLYFEMYISWQVQHSVTLDVQISFQVSADFVAGAALGEPRSADFVASTALCEPRSADFVASTALCEPRSADFGALCSQMLTLSPSPLWSPMRLDL